MGKPVYMYLRVIGICTVMVVVAIYICSCGRIHTTTSHLYREGTYTCVNICMYIRINMYFIYINDTYAFPASSLPINKIPRYKYTKLSSSVYIYVCIYVCRYEYIELSSSTNNVYTYECMYVYIYNYT